jgi:uncharacterized protein (DUF433 family)
MWPDVITRPEVLGGTPVIRGTRVPAAYPSLDADKVELAAIYAQATPPRGRPRRRPEPPKGAAVIADRRIAARPKAK